MATTDSTASATVVGTRAPVQAGHTPGPWEISKTGTLPIYVAVKDGRWKDAPGTMLAEVGGNLQFGPGDFQESLANARLIAAAPRMFAVLKKLSDEMEAGKSSASIVAHACIEINASIAQASGDRTDASTAQPAT